MCLKAGICKFLCKKTNQCLWSFLVSVKHLIGAPKITFREMGTSSWVRKNSSLYGGLNSMHLTAKSYGGEYVHYLHAKKLRGLPRWCFSKNLPANAENIRHMGSIPGLGRSPGGGHGNPLQYSCLESPMDRGAWRAIVHRVAESQTRLKWLSMCATPQINPPLSSLLGTQRSFLLWKVHTVQKCQVNGSPLLRETKKIIDIYLTPDICWHCEKHCF